jgi:hypothetical protein
MDGSLICAQCGKAHPPSHMEPSFQRPDEYWNASPALYGKSWADNNFCVLGGRRYFVRGLLPVTIVDEQRVFCIGAWAEIDHDTFHWARHVFTPHQFRRASPLWGRIANDMRRYLPGQSVGARVAIRFHRNMRPYFFLRFSGYAFEQEQRAGITSHRRAEICELAFGKQR